MTAELPPRYSPADVEGKISEIWKSERLFHAEPGGDAPSYCIVIPPPNVTSRLHVGHALDNTLQDALIRYHRMRGDNTVWMPGTDHAGIATQTVVEKRVLAEEGKRRTDFERSEFVARIQAWKDEYEAVITSQLQLMGCSCDWDRQRFTMDEVCARAVRELFFRLFEDGLIYRGKRLVNWDPATQTVLADDEVEHEDVHGHFWYMQYPLEQPVECGGKRIEHVTVATTRPETMLGDTAVAMNPTDPRAEALVGKMVRLPIVGRLIPIIVDDHVVLPDPESEDEKARFSTGFLKVTPAHDPDDYQIGQRHDLPIINVMAPDATISDRHGWDDATAPEAQKLIGMDRFEAREAIVAWFRTEKLLEDVREYVHPVGHSYRSHVPIEPYLSDQWYVAVKKPVDRLADNFGSGLIDGTDVPKDSLAGLALAPLLDGRVSFTPERYAGTYQSWLENLRDWPISRQLWWGHQIPVWSKAGTHEVGDERVCVVSIESDDGPVTYATVAAGNEDSEKQLEADGWQRDADVLDTWFSSALWPFSTLGWPEETGMLETFYPGNVLCTAREIITLWVSRMVMMGQYCMGDIPFPDVFIHAMIQDGEGRKMSKSLGNGIDPLDIIASHGADAMRFTLLLMTTQTQDVRMPVEEHELPDGRIVNSSPKFDVGRNFSNKLWNAARFALMNLNGAASHVDLDKLEFEDRWILTRRNRVIEAVAGALDSYRFNDAAQAIYDFTWHDFCDWYVEIVKPRLNAEDGSGGQAKAVVAQVLDTILRLLHPLMPFITEELWGHLAASAPTRGLGEAVEPAKRLIVAEWPKVAADLDAPKLEADMVVVQDIIRAVRNIRSKMNIAGKNEIEAVVSSSDAAIRAAVAKNKAFIQHLVNLSDLTVGESLDKPAQAATEVVGQTEVYVALAGLIDLGEERARLEKKLAEVQGRLTGVERKLSNESFVSKAPAEIVDRERAKAEDLRQQAEAVGRNLADLA
jgi:valyl-tRNA synthetase